MDWHTHINTNFLNTTLSGDARGHAPRGSNLQAFVFKDALL